MMGGEERNLARTYYKVDVHNESSFLLPCINDKTVWHSFCFISRQ